MSRFSAPGLRTRIVISLVLVMTLFIVLTQLTISQLVRVSLTRNELSVSDKSVNLDNVTIATSSHGEHELNRLRRMVLFYLIIGAVIVIVLGSIAVTKAVIKPLSQITEAVERVAGGNLEVKVPIGGSGELIQLGVSFNRMTHTLKEQRTEMEQQLTSLKQFSDDLKDAQERLIRAAKLASVGTLAAGVAHEIGNPIAGILGLLDALDNETDTKVAKSYRTLVRKEIQRIDRIITELLIYARPVKYEGEKPPSTNLVLAVKHVENLLKTQRLFRQIKINITAIDKAMYAAMSQDDLTQLLVNLMLNAAQAMDGEGEITIDATSLDNWRTTNATVLRSAIKLSIMDNGPGVDAAIADQIFDPFFTKRSTNMGSGLGLAICQNICDRAGAEIFLDKKYRDGALIAVIIPG